MFCVESKVEREGGGGKESERKGDSDSQKTRDIQTKGGEITMKIFFLERGGGGKKFSKRKFSTRLEGPNFPLLVPRTFILVPG
jgi:hypothetical protein